MPQVLVVDCYSKVTLQNNDIDTHLISSGSQDDGPKGWFASTILNPGDVYSYVFDRPGIWDAMILCTVGQRHCNCKER
ncbi:MAG: hypothetical protein KGI25_03675 [Thaumarchaeota archaeon]|nr:hypothetical protein [Nitrososphaerota archaeon]